MIEVKLTFDSYEEAVRVKKSCEQILNEYMSGEDPFEHAAHGTPKNALEILYDALQDQVPQTLTEKVMGSREDTEDTDAWDDFNDALQEVADD
ncbi:MAG: hypothetical protein J6Y02_03930 [Pseudobutyrivibrio sp.]|nr:hypothetical protein [Pseudobutyrivibrio sp.]